MPTRAERKLERIITRAAVEAHDLLRAEAQKVLDASPRYESFAAAMGTVCFYRAGDGLPVYDEDLTARARRVVELGGQVTEHFGSPGYCLRPRMRPIFY